MSKKLYIGNVPYRASDSELQELFGEVGPVVSATIVKDKMTGRSRGFAFVEMETESDAQSAISKFNGYDFNGRPLIVSEAKPKMGEG